VADHYEGDPATNPQDAVRFYAGDTNPDDPQYSGAEVDFALAQGGTNRGAAALLMEMLARNLMREADYSEGPVSEQLQQRSKNLLETAQSLRDQEATVGGSVGAALAATDEVQERDPLFERDTNLELPDA
jgi:hypothetical protein